MIRHEHHDSVCFIPCHSGCFGNSAGRIHKKRHERRENFFAQSSDTVRKPDLQGYACRQRRTDDMEKICGKCNDFFRYRACFSVPASTSAGSSSRKPAESFRCEMGFGI